MWSNAGGPQNSFNLKRIKRDFQTNVQTKNSVSVVVLALAFGKKEEQSIITAKNRTECVCLHHFSALWNHLFFFPSPHPSSTLPRLQLYLSLIAKGYIWFLTITLILIKVYSFVCCFNFQFWLSRLVCHKALEKVLSWLQILWKKWCVRIQSCICKFSSCQCWFSLQVSV